MHIAFWDTFWGIFGRFLGDFWPFFWGIFGPFFGGFLGIHRPLLRDFLGLRAGLVLVVGYLNRRWVVLTGWRTVAGDWWLVSLCNFPFPSTRARVYLFHPHIQAFGAIHARVALSILALF